MKKQYSPKAAAEDAIGERSKVETDLILSDVISIFQSNIGKHLSLQDAKKVINGINSIRDLSLALSSYPRHLFQSLFENHNYYNNCILVCNVLDIRNILDTKIYNSINSISLLSLGCAKKLIKTYKCFIILDGEPNKIDSNFFTAGGISVLNSGHLDISGRIKGIIVSQDAPFNEIEKIVSECIPGLPIYGESYIPGLDIKKIASNSNKYIISLPALKINKLVVKAPNDYEAVERALSIKWHQHPDSFKEKKPQRYTAEYWINSGFWNSIVKTASENKPNITIASNDLPSINLSDEERQVFSIILDIDKQFNLGQQYRIAGGWVRDRLLNIPSDDIDIALDKMTGLQFAKYVNQYAQTHPEFDLGDSYTVDQNPDKSKHLETTAIKMGNFKIDFVNLRDESYGDSRVPQMKMSNDPKVDAQRRDLTINALFYNINTGQIEDYVGGLQDIKTMTLRTPLDPVKTFSDDPLRMLRVLRFNSRYPNANIDPSILSAMNDPGVQDAYRNKVSPERAGPEIMKLFGGMRPEESVRVLYQTGLDKTILNLPDFSNLHHHTMDQRNPNHKLNWLDHTLKVMKNLNQILSQNNIQGKDRSLALMASWFHDFGKLHPDIGKPKDNNPNHMTYHGHEDVSAQLSESFLKSIGIGADDRQIVNLIVQEHMVPHSYNKDWNKKQMGKLRQKTTLPGKETKSDLWKFVMWHAQADAAAKSDDSKIEDFPDYQERFNKMDEYMNAPPPMQPLIDGRRMIELFPSLLPKSGFINEIKQRLLEEQGAQNVTTPQEAEAFIQSIRGEIESKYSQQPPTNPQSPIASTWYSSIKLADASSASDTSGYYFSPSGENNKERHANEKHMIYYSPGSSSVYRVGDKVKRRNSGLAMKQDTGKIIKKHGPIIRVRWDSTGKEQNFDIESIETQSLLERV